MYSLDDVFDMNEALAWADAIEWAASEAAREP